MKNLLINFGISEDIINEYLSAKYFNQSDLTLKKKTDKKLNLSVNQCDLPPKSYYLKDADLSTDMWANVAIEYLHSRNLKQTDYPWVLSDDKQYRDRIIIPFYQNKHIVYWQARSFDDDTKLRYINADKPKTNVIFNYDILYNKNKNVFIPEGVFDAIPLNTICLTGGSLPENKIEILKRFDKNYIFIIDEDANGYKVGKKAISEGWKITHLNDGIDVNKSIKKFGKIFTCQQLIQNVKEDMCAEIWLEFMHNEYKTKKRNK